VATENIEGAQREIGGHHRAPLAGQCQRERADAGRTFEVETGSSCCSSEAAEDPAVPVCVPRSEKLRVSAPDSFGHERRIAMMNSEFFSATIPTHA
jgi:hypothetical protein